VEENKMTEEKELNEKLARWRWPEAHSIQCYPDPLVEGYNIEIKINELSILSDWFTDSLDAIFKWLVPKVGEIGLDLKLSRTIEPKWRVILSNYTDRPPTIGDNNNPALALCLAIEKLIDEH